MKLTLPPALRLDWGVLAARLGWVALVALLTLLQQHGFPRETRDLLTYGAAATGAMIAALPSALLASGLRRPVSPEFASLCQHFGQLFTRPSFNVADVQAVVKAEMQNATPQLIQLAADEVLNRTNMDGYSRAELGLPELAPKAGDGPSDPDAPAEAPTPPTAATAATVDAIVQTGGNQ